MLIARGVCSAGNNIVELSDQEQDSSQEKNSPAQPQPELEYREGTANITDYSPEWAYPEVTDLLLTNSFSFISLYFQKVSSIWVNKMTS